MNTLKKLLIALLALSMLCAPLSSCKKNGSEENPSAEPEQTEEREEVFEPIVLCDTKTCYYCIVRPNSTLASVTDAASDTWDTATDFVGNATDSIGDFISDLFG